MPKDKPEIRFAGYTNAWEKRRLIDNTKLITKGTTPKDKSGVGNVNFIKVENLSNNQIHPVQKISQEEHDSYLKRSRLQANDILFSIAGTLGRIAIVSSSLLPANTNQALSIIRGYDFDSDFLITSLSGHVVAEYIRKNPTVGAQPNLSLEQVGNLIISSPIEEEQEKIGSFFKLLNHLITVNQRKVDLLKELKKGFLQKMFPKNGEDKPEIRFGGYTDAWGKRKLGDQYQRVSERNNGQFDKTRWISVAKMYFQDSDKVTSNNIDTRTYVMRKGDIAFEGHPNKKFMFGRFVENDIGDGIVSELFPIYRHSQEYDLHFWKYAVQIERIWKFIFAKSITSSGNSSNKLDTRHLFRQSIFIPDVTEQEKIGSFLSKLDQLIAINQRRVDLLKQEKKALLQKMFV